MNRHLDLQDRYLG